ncbi:MAG TPA: hypothetical protein VL098_14025 [Flavipsychrobacter sp.]|nr:hypothetical protein [Flavipsychrobacter sp.]
MRIIVPLITASLLLAVSCKDKSGKTHGSIALGDSSTIITETDSTYLQDYVSSVTPQTMMSQETEEPADTATTPPATVTKPDTPKTAVPPPVTPSPATTGKGLNVEFSEVTVFIPNIVTKAFKNQNIKSLNGVSYQITSGTLQGNQLVIKGATVQKVSQRYISTFIVTKGDRKIELPGMEQTTSWQTVSGNNGVYSIKGLEASKLSYKKTSVAAVRNAVSRAAKAARYNRKEIAEWESSVRNLRSVTQAPVSIVLQSVMWKIEGKDAKGKSFSKEVRLDLPL